MCLPKPSLHRQTEVIAHVAQNVGKLSLQDKAIIDNKAGESATSTSTPQPTSSTPKMLTLEESDKGDKRAATTTTLPTRATLVSKQQLQHALDLATAAARANVVATPPDVSATDVGCSVVAPTPTEDMPLKKGPLRWKRVQRVAEGDNPNQTKALTTQGGALGAPRSRPGLEDDDFYMQPSLKKKIIFPVPPLEECLGAENLRKLIEEENTPPAIRKTRLPEAIDNSQEGEDSDSFVLITRETQEFVSGMEGRDVLAQEGHSRPHKPANEEEVEKETEKEATSIRAAGQLTGAKDRACQKK
jgi:hypothetical protein